MVDVPNEFHLVGGERGLPGEAIPDRHHEKDLGGDGLEEVGAGLGGGWVGGLWEERGDQGG